MSQKISIYCNNYGKRCSTYRPPSYFLRFTPPADLRDVDSGGEAEDSDDGDDDPEELGREGSGLSLCFCLTLINIHHCLYNCYIYML